MESGAPPGGADPWLAPHPSSHPRGMVSELRRSVTRLRWLSTDRPREYGSVTRFPLPSKLATTTCPFRIPGTEGRSRGRCISTVAESMNGYFSLSAGLKPPETTDIGMEAPPDTPLEPEVIPPSAA